tara:strand:+ start:226 stop:417 length:192 start_codon:yes stop_codon:yes gene_type:complete
MLTIPLIRAEEMNLTPIERSAMRCEQLITALMMEATITDPTITPAEIVTFTTLSVATITPAEA